MQFTLDHALHVADRLDHAKVDVTPVHKGPQHASQGVDFVAVAGDGTRLDHRIALPVAGLRMVVVLHGIVGDHQRAGITEWPQPHVHAEYETIGGLLAQHIDQLATHAGEELLVLQRSLAVGATVFGKAEDQIDIRRQIEFAGTQFAHTQHDQLLLLAVGGARDAGFRGGPAIQTFQRLADAHVSELGQIFEGLVQRRQTTEITPYDAQHFALAETPQLHLECCLVGDILQCSGQCGGHITALIGRFEQPGGVQVRQQRRIAQAGVRSEVTERPYRVDLLLGGEARRQVGDARRVTPGAAVTLQPLRGRFFTHQGCAASLANFCNAPCIFCTTGPRSVMA